jgi:inner membrane protein YidH
MPGLKELPMHEIAPQIDQPNKADHLAWINTMLGFQRTLMSAERTAVTLIAFGFTLAQLFRSMESKIPTRLLVLGPDLPRNVGLLMVAAGVGTLALFVWEYLRAVAYLSSGPFENIALSAKAPLHQLTCITAYAIMVIGILAFASVFITF